MNKKFYLHLHPETKGAIAQLVEQRTENPCVLGSIPSGTTTKNPVRLNIKILQGFFIIWCAKIKARIFYLFWFRIKYGFS